MKWLKTIITRLFGNYFGLSSFIFGLVSVVSIFVQDSKSAIIALCAFCSFLVLVLVGIFHTFYRIGGNSKNISDKGYETKACFIKYIQSSPNDIVYESYKTIQSVIPFITELDMGFKWSGSKLPKIESSMQEVSQVVKNKNNSEYDKAILKLKTPIFFNNVGIIHFKAMCDDVDNIAESYLSIKILNNTNLVSYNVVLKYKDDDFHENAIIEKLKFGGESTNSKEKIDEVMFDQETKSYEYVIVEPEVGYIYTMSWTK